MVYHYDSRNQRLDNGDQIEFERGDLRHWGIYDNGFIIHVTAPDNFTNDYKSGRVGQLTDATLGKIRTVIKRDRLEDIIQGCKYYKNNQLDQKYKPYSKDDIIRRARQVVGQKWDYYLLSKNCEHFVNEIRYDQSTSLQSTAATVTMAGIFTGSLIAAFTGHQQNQDNDK